tara:strand:- start:205 stop:507 length:303 start_codon:yes stop_codon:yes gene_type:complete
LNPFHHNLFIDIANVHSNISLGLELSGRTLGIGEEIYEFLDRLSSCEAFSRKRLTASFRLSSDSRCVCPWLAMSNSGLYVKYMSSSNLRIAVDFAFMWFY